MNKKRNKLAFCGASEGIIKIALNKYEFKQVELVDSNNYDYVVINDKLDECYLKINNLIDAEINNGSKDYDKNYIRRHVDSLTL